MLLNVEKILESFVKSNDFGKPAQVGYDLTVKNIRRIEGGVLTKEKAYIDQYKDMQLVNWGNNVDKVIDGWHLQKGVYSLTFHQSIKLNEFHTAFICPKSSLLRIGAFIASGVFDPGFECEEIGATMFVFNAITIENEASVAQIIIHENYQAVPYNGNYQKEKDLK